MGTKLRKYGYLVIAMLLGMAVFIGIYGLEPLRITGINWMIYGFYGKDITSHQSGWMFYRASPWTFPLCKALFLGYPEGTVISYTDSIPIAALFFKLLSPLLPETFQFFGLYTCFCFMMQGLFAAALLRLLTGDKLFSVIGSVIFLSASCFVERCIRHTALSSHWLLLAALLLYFHQRRDRSGGKYSVLWCLLLCLALGIHPYLFAMVFSVFALSEAECFFIGRDKVKTVLVSVICTAGALLFGYILGLFGTKVSPETGFGEFSLNLNTLVNPYSKNHELWSAVLKPLPRADGQGDGMCYLGLPMLVLTAAAILFSLKNYRGIRNSLLRNAGLLILCAGLTLFAISNRVTLGDRVILRYPLPGLLFRLCNIFRSSDRFFFIPYYCIILFSLTRLRRMSGRKRSWLTLCVCAAAAVLQILEIGPGLKELHAFFETRYEPVYLSGEWSRIAENYDTARTVDRIKDRNLSFWLGENGFRTDLMVTAPVHLNAYWDRTETERTRLRQALEDGTEDLDPRSVYIISAVTGRNRTFETDEDLAAYIGKLQKAWQDKADLLYLNNEINYYWILCPDQQTP